MDFQKVFNISITLFFILDPIGNVPLVVSILKQFNPKEQRRIIIRELVISLIIMILFLYFGKEFFKIFNIGNPELKIAGGIILFLIAIKMVFSKALFDKNVVKKDPLIVPLAVPSITGPGILATISLYGGTSENKMTVLVAIVIAWLLALPILLLSSFLKKWLGKNGLIALERLIGFIVVLLAIQMMIEGFILQTMDVWLKN